MKKYIKPIVEVETFEMNAILGTVSSLNNEVGGGDWNAKEYNSQSFGSNTFNLWGDDEE